MKKLYLIGDSIRMNYDKYVKMALDGKAEVYTIPENARFAAYTYYRLGDWICDLRPNDDIDVVHWNVGLHDVVHLHDAEPVTPPDVYGYYLERICRKLEDLYPRAQKIFATTTPVQENLYDKVWFYRNNNEIEKLNEVALKVMQKYGYPVDDLHAVIGACRPEDIYQDKTHFNFKGSCLLAKSVLTSACPYLRVEPNYDNMKEVNENRQSEILK